MQKVEIIAKIIANLRGYALKIDPDATVTDYLKAVENLVEAGEYYREAGTKSCLKCVKCCYERIPLTNVDVIMLRRGLGEKNGQNIDLYHFLRDYTEIFIKGWEIDIILKRNENGACVFLNEKDRKCEIYAFRPFVCRSFYCIPTTEETETIRMAVVNLGEDALVREYLLYLREYGLTPYWTRAVKPKLNVNYYPKNIFWKKENYEIRIKDILQYL
ncbi:Fe-S-cluster containining protein [Carboxydothermus ferrireducens DSM 11255]|uniref:Fe-S-cluster containining protein n=1 Tax=Carboxydothermus ferrireducens DSM 11255 TaxID=1119529 RepID=A0ABX2RAM2_9THEO|nr:Fe-S-cluster containining protein [Carboxydothermus ferrireducens DSM 11255]